MAALTVALGIGATATVFSVVNPVLLRPLPFPHPEQLYWVTEWLGRIKAEVSVAPDYFTMQENMRDFSEMAAHGGSTPMSWTGIDRPRQVTAEPVTASFFPLFGVQPLFGRVFRTEEDKPGGEFVCVLSYRFWLQAFGGDMAVLGQTIRLDRRPARIIGIMPRRFNYPSSTDVWIPLQLSAAQHSREGPMRIVQIVARAKPGVPAPQVDAELNRLMGIVSNEFPASLRGSGFIDGMRVYARPLQQQLTGNVRPALLVFTGAVALMLLIVCFNVAGLMLARAMARRREIAVRLALGAPRWRIIRQLLTESLLVSLLGGGLGIMLAWSAATALNSSKQLAAAGLPEISLNTDTILFTLALSVLTGLVFGLAPAFGSLGFSLREALHRETRSATGGVNLQRMRQALVAAQLGLSLTLLIGAGLLANSFFKLRSVDPGLRVEGVLTARIALTGPAYNTPQRQIAFFQQLVESLKREPRVQSVALTKSVPLSGDRGGNQGVFRIENRPPVPRGREPQTFMTGVSPDFFQTISIPLLQGRLLAPSDSQGRQRVIVINEAFAKKYFPNENPLGQRITFGVSNAPAWLEIVGVVRNIRQMVLSQEAEPIAYAPLSQVAGSIAYMGLLVRSSSDPLNLVPTVQKAVTTLDPDELVYDVQTMDQRVSDSLGSRRFNAVLTGCFALIASILAAIGVYGVMSYLVTLRTQEMSIRLALGAQPNQILGLVLREGLLLGVLGSALGIAGALALSRYLSKLLYGITTRDTLTFVASTLALLGAVLLACYFPAHRAAHGNPAVALRHD